MSLKLAAPIVRKLKPLSRGNPLQGNLSISPAAESTQTRFGPDRTLDARGGPQAAENALPGA